MSLIAFSSVAAQPSSPARSSHTQTSHAQTSQQRVHSAPNLFQLMSIRYELCHRTGLVIALYRDGYSVVGYDTIDQFYADMATEGWQVDSTQQARSCSLHFSVLKRAL